MTIKRNITFLCLLFYPVIIFAQDFNIGVRANYLTNFTRNYFEEGIYWSDNERNWKEKEFSGDVIFENVRPNGIFRRVRVGYQKTFASYNHLSDYSGITGKSFYINKKEYGKEYRFAAGIGKLFEFEKLFFKVGAELFVNIGNIWYKNSAIEYFDVNGVKYKTNEIDFDEPWHSSGGISLFSNIYYNFWKSFSVGLEITNYFQYSQQKGTIKIIYDDYDGNGNLISSDIENDKINEKDFSASFLIPSIGLYYRF